MQDNEEVCRFRRSYTFFSYTVGTLLVFALTLVPMRQVVPTAEAAGGGVATSFNQMINNAEQRIQTLRQTVIAGNSGVSAVGITSLVNKEILDGIAWAVAKQMVSQMTKSMVEWINSGFQGDPAFITDLNGFLLDALDNVAGNYIQSLGGIGEFVCSPFQLDVQAALTINYAQARSGMPSGPTAPSCSLSDISNNIENFLDGTKNADWSDWLTITSNPQNTPYGAYLAAEASLNARLINSAGQEIEIANWGGGFLSKKICEGINGAPAAEGENCRITTPGEVISQALTIQLATGPSSLVEADEINEIIGALINQLSLKAMQGINGLLGLGGNSNYTDYSDSTDKTKSYLDNAIDENTNISVNSIRTQMGSTLATEREYSTLASSTLTEITTQATRISRGAAAISAIFGSSNNTDALLGITVASTINEASSSLAALGSGGSNATRVTIARAQLADVSAAVLAVTQVSAVAVEASTTGNLTFTQLVNEGVRAQTSLTELTQAVIPIKTQTDTNITALTAIIGRFDAASSTATTSSSANDRRQSAVLDYIALANTGKLTTASIVAAKRAEWAAALR